MPISPTRPAQIILAALLRRSTYSGYSMTRLYPLTLIVTAALISAYAYAQTIGAQCQQYCAEMLNSILDGTAASPYRYRPLSAWLTSPFASAGVPIAYSIAHALALPAMFVMLYAWLRQWMDEKTALIGVLLTAAFMPLMIQVWGIALYAPLEVVFLCAALLLLVRKPPYWRPAYVLLTAIATLNRETAVLLPLALIVTEDLRQEWRTGLLALLVWASVFAGLRLWLGAAPDTLTVAETWALNTGGGWYTIVAILKNAFFVPLWILAVIHAHRAPAPLQRLALVGLPYLALCLVFALWHEVRLWLPLLVLWLPLALYERGKVEVP
jgi:hypothetical protein